ncbi:MAG: tRNA (adenosine(37)-N6)-dimethylallyltransferase MiaA [Planctomycetaceae bacterium]|nr:tRNA (adenosine(37)-N6)-dimethylallyltransferase MiaA [Planctomycetaceae bacterium]
MQRKVVSIVGPTASGKTGLGIAVAKALARKGEQAEIINADAYQMYRGMDIGTAKPSLEERARIPHHLIDVAEPHEEYSLADYLTAAGQCCREIAARGRLPLFAGGTGLYLRGLLFGLFEGPPGDQAIRQQLEQDAARQATGWLHRKLAEVDPIAAGRLHPNDTRRLVRALEVYEVTGQPISAWQQQSLRPADERPRHVFWLSPPREWLYQRINSRVDRMLEDGLVDEVRQLLEAPGGLSRTARQALGYREVIEALEGRCTLEEAAETIRTRTRQFAKRQHTWFRNLPHCREIRITGRETPEELARYLQQAAEETA